MKTAEPIQISRRLTLLWGPRGRRLVEDVLSSVPASLGALALHLVVIDPRRRQALWAGSRPGRAEAAETEAPCPPTLTAGPASHMLGLAPVLGALGDLDRLHCIPLARGKRNVGILVVDDPPPESLATLRRHARICTAALLLLHDAMVDQRELEGYRALSHLLDVGAPKDRRSLARALGRSMASVTRARTCLVLARADATQPLVVIGSRGYNTRRTQNLVMWPEEEPWASALMAQRVVEIAPERLDSTWRGALGDDTLMLVPVRWLGWVRSALIFPADADKTGGTHLVDPAQLGSVGAHAGLLWQNAELLRRLRRDEEVLQGLMQRSIQVQEEERRRIASDIHDGVTQRIVGIWFRLLALEKLLPEPPDGDEVRRAMQTIKEQVDLSMQEARAAIYNLRPSTLDDLGLVPSLRSLVSEFRADTQVDVDLEVRDERRLPDHIEVGIYRIAQEGLRNIRKHARATRVRLTVQMSPDKVRLTLTDDGRGFMQKKKGAGRLKSFGLESMAERAQMMGAELFVSSTPGEGTRVRASIPVPPEAQA